MNWKFKLAAVVMLVLIIFLYINIADFNPVKKDDGFIEKISELESKIDSLNHQKDNVKSIIDSTHIKIITNEKHYQKRINTIITQPDSFSESFTRQYLRNYATTHGYSIIGTSEVE